MLSFEQLCKSKQHQTKSPLEALVVEKLVYLDLPVEFETQYKVDPYRLDIAFTDFKIGLEIDGREYHDPVKDKLRDEYLVSVCGWKIERVPGWFAYRHPKISIFKAVRHIEAIKNHKIFKHLKAKTDLWHYRELMNEGYEKEAIEVRKKFLTLE